MNRFFVPELVEFELVEGGVQMTFWVNCPETKFMANINGIDYVFLSTGTERLVRGKFARGFKAVPKGSGLYMITDLSDCLVTYPLGTFRPSSEDCDFGPEKR